MQVFANFHIFDRHRTLARRAGLKNLQIVFCE
jgi:hypothetical protein